MELRKLLCVVMDGVGESENIFGNAYKAAYTPNLEWLKTHSSFRTIYAHGTHVGLPTDADIGNSEVGHNAIGAGQVFDQGAKLVQKSIDEQTLFTGGTWRELTQYVRGHQSTLHFIGLLSDGNVHSHISHLFALMEEAVRDQITKIRIHVLFDGRDVGEKSAEIYVRLLLDKIQQLSAHGCDIRVASGGGRMTTTMDRYGADWSMVERGWKAHVLGEAERYFHDLESAVSVFRAIPDMTDQYFPSFVITEEGHPVGRIHDGDGVVFFNFRGDRAIEICRAFTEKEFLEFNRGLLPDIYFAGMMEYDGDLHVPPKYLVSPPFISHTLGEYLADQGVRQFACSETQKYGHVTYFWNGNRSGQFDAKLEQYLEIPSDNIEFNLRPWMKAAEICDATIAEMKSPNFQFGRINFANGDMVGHTGDFEAAVIAMSTVDIMIGRLIKAARETNTILLITADHGNCDEMFDDDARKYPGWTPNNLDYHPRPKTSHTLSKVPLFIFDPQGQRMKWRDMPQGGLGNLAATICDVMHLKESPYFMPSLVTVTK